MRGQATYVCSVLVQGLTQAGSHSPEQIRTTYSMPFKVEHVQFVPSLIEPLSCSGTSAKSP